jgi:hypothetical protein
MNKIDKRTMRKYIWGVLAVLICLAFLAEILILFQ